MSANRDSGFYAGGSSSSAQSNHGMTKVSPSVYLEMNRISLLGDLVLHLLCSSFPDEPIGAIAAFLDILSQNEKSHLQVVDPPRPSVEMNPMVRDYLQRHRIAFLVEEWLGEICRIQPENPLLFSSQYFLRLHASRIRKGAAAPPAPSSPPPVPELTPGGSVSSILAGADRTPTPASPTEVPVPQQSSRPPSRPPSRPASVVSDRSSLSPLQSRDEMNNSPTLPPANPTSGSLSPLTPALSQSRPGSVTRRTRLLILVYSLHGHCEALAFAAMDGVMRNPQVDAYMYRFPEVLSDEAQEKMGVRKRHPDDPGYIPELEDVSVLPTYDGFVFIFPTRFGSRPAAVQALLDRTGGLWAQQQLVGKVAGVMVSSATQHGGQERTIRSFQNSLLHHGMIIVGANPREVDAIGISSVAGCSPYGASTIAGSDGARMPSEAEMRVAGNHAARVASFAVALHRH